ncbi:uncharacterized protein LOC142514302, partial [Primulina tabacum]|uniref:uncharacterized protein LOC142514302 n=1 Tax=Primulina tabacum TaxID=48773 RepID=UPI003F5A1BC0
RPRCLSQLLTEVIITCKATEVSPQSSLASASCGEDGKNWVPAVLLSALPKGERRVIIQDGEIILLLWYKDDVIAIENRSPAEGAYSEGLLNAKLTQDGCIVCPTTYSTFDLRTGEIKDWCPTSPVLRVLAPPLRTLFVYPAKSDGENIFIILAGGTKSDASTEIVFSRKAQSGFTAIDVNVDEVRMVVDEDLEGFGFTGKNVLINGRAAIIGFLVLLDFELLTGKGLLKGTGFLDFIYSYFKHPELILWSRTSPDFFINLLLKFIVSGFFLNNFCFMEPFIVDTCTCGIYSLILRLIAYLLLLDTCIKFQSSDVEVVGSL